MDINAQFMEVKKHAVKLANASSSDRNNVLAHICKLLDEKREDIKSVNKIDIDSAIANELTNAMVDRLRLDDKAINSMIQAVNEIIAQEEVVGAVIEGVTRPNGLKINKVRVPLGVVGMIYESRPNVTIDSAALCIKSGNGVVLRGGKEAINSNRILADIVSTALEQAGFSREVVYFIDDTDRARIGDIARAKGVIDVIIPRGGSALINYVVENALIPVVMHDKGVCHLYIDDSAEKQMALDIALNAKAQRPSACNAIETLLIHENVADDFLNDIAVMFREAGVEVRACEKAASVIGSGAILATEDDWYAEYLELIISIKVVKDIDEAMAHIAKYGSSHSEAIVTSNYANAERFLNEVDSSAVYVNASTRFTDGGEFGLGAEIGISTQKLHVRGPMGAKDLTTTKYVIYGNGQVR